MTVIGLTGGIGSGKTTVGRLLVERGAKILDTDVVARDALQVGTGGHDAVVDRFGDAVLAPDGTIDRPGLAKIVFADPVALRDLEAIVHPVVQQVVKDTIAATDSEAVLVLEVPLLILDSGQSRYAVDGVLVVDVPEDIAHDRLVTARGMDGEDADRRIAAQIPRAMRISAADFVILNTGTFAELVQMVDNAWKWIDGLGKARLDTMG